MKVKYLSNRFDELAISLIKKLAFSDVSDLLSIDLAVLSALRRSSPSWDLPISEIAKKLSTYDDSQLGGLVNNVKGILHEIEFQILENEDGDSIYAALFPDTNHKSVDVRLFDENTGESWDIQLKATDNVSNINSWIDSNPNTEIYVTDEIAQTMGLNTSGFSNEELEIRVEDFVDKLIENENKIPTSFWDNFPVLIVASSGIIIFELWRRYRKGNISLDQFKRLTLRTLGVKAAKYTGIFVSLSIPGLNFIVGSYLLASLIISVGSLVKKSPSWKPFSFLERT
tara:strand:- start:210 stop:1061 length:852 start_codon:yes stop_codon:yes gene_type:complete